VLYAFDPQGNNIGEMTYGTQPGSHPTVEVDEAWRRKGVATALYREAQAAGGHIPPADSPEAMRSPEGAAFRQGLAGRAPVSGPEAMQAMGAPGLLEHGDALPARPWREVGATVPSANVEGGRTEAFGRWLARGPGWPQTLQEALDYAEGNTVNPEHGYVRPAGTPERTPEQKASFAKVADEIRKTVAKGIIAPDEGLYAIIEHAGAKGLPPLEKAIRPMEGAAGEAQEQARRTREALELGGQAAKRMDENKAAPMSDEIARLLGKKK
jgi:hypothetical protein